MPGSSLWLLPPSGHPLDSTVASLITETSAHFGSPHSFLPHITLTSNISPSVYGSEPQEWLDSLNFPAQVDVHLQHLASEDVFFRKLYIKIAKTERVQKVGAVSRKAVEGFEGDEKAGKWAEEEYMPHLSLLYHDCPKISEEEISKIRTLVTEAGVNLEGKGELGGWVGGRVVLVPTDRPIKDWSPIAERVL